MDRGAWQATVHGVTKSQTPLSEHTHTHTHTSHPVILGQGILALMHVLSSCISIPGPDSNFKKSVYTNELIHETETDSQT